LNKEVEAKIEKLIGELQGKRLPDHCDPVGRILEGFHRFKTTKFEYDNATQRNDQ
jgi:carbonic anhydrase